MSRVNLLLVVAEYAGHGDCLFVALAQVLREMCRKLVASNNALTLVDDKLDMFESVFAPTIGVFGVDRFHCTLAAFL